ncbi:MAG: calcium/sodium antiporter [Pseudomonadales bacterium]|nr:calcium/sodium antiporter [Pseudomonadales bacterium]
MNLILVLLGLALLTAGGEGLIRGALTAASRLGVSPLVAGLLIVGFGTSAPEMAISIDAVLNQRAGIAIGNVVGSNIANILLILGVCALITPIMVSPKSLLRDGLAVLVATVLFMLVAADGDISLLDASLLLLALGIYFFITYQTEKRISNPADSVLAAEAQEMSALPASWTSTLVYIIGGLLLLISGSRILLTGASNIAVAMGVPDELIGLTLVAIGTSLPELTISVLAALRRHADVAVGNVLGSNLFNILGILGVTGLIDKVPVTTTILQFDQWVMLAAAVALLVFLGTGMKLSRLEGALLLAAYAGYVSFSFLG